MSIAAIVLERHDWPQDETEAYAFSHLQVASLLPILRERVGPAIVLSTCARLEAYAETASPEQLAGLFTDAARRSLGRTLDAARFVMLDEPSASHHLFRVASGLESAVIGEFEILGQVRSAFSLATASGDLGTALPRLFHAAVRAGRRVRAETGVARGCTSLASAALSLATREVGDLEGRNVLVVGAGEIGGTAARHAHSLGANVLLVNRSLERAAPLASELGVMAHPLEALPVLLPLADCVISCTSAPHQVLGCEVIATARRGTGGRYAILDLAAPRDVDPAARDLPGVVLHDLETIQAFSREASRLRESEVAAAQKIIDEELTRFLEWRHGARVTPTIAALRRQADEVCRRAVTMTFAKLPHLNDGDRERLGFMANAIASQLLAQPIARLKAAPDPETYATLVVDLFGLSPASEAPAGPELPASHPFDGVREPVGQPYA